MRRQWLLLCLVLLRMSTATCCCLSVVPSIMSLGALQDALCIFRVRDMSI